MNFNTITLSSDELDKLYEKTESHFLDFKSRDIKPSKITKSISAFANADGGEIFLGILEKPITKEKTWESTEDHEFFNAYVETIEQVLPLGGDITYEYLAHPENHSLVLHIEIRKTREIIKDSSGNVFVRRGPQSLPVRSDEALERLKLNKGISSFETQTIDIPLEFVENSEQTVEFMLETVPHQEPKNWLAKQLLIRENKPTIACVMLFADEPQVALPKQSGIKIYRYRTEGDEGTRDTLVGQPETIEGSVYKQIFTAVSRVSEIISGINIMREDKLVQITYPSETIHEILTNAVLHRDYSLPDDIHIRIYDNRVEIESPGILPGHITPINILDERFSRNGNIVRYINKFPNPPNMDVGEGLNTAFRAMEQLKLRVPGITQKDHSVLVTIRHERLASPEELIIEFLGKNPAISNKDARQICVIREDWRVRSIFGRMVKAGLIEKVPGSVTSSTAYQLVSN